MPYCLNCGREVPLGAKFCGNCGAPVGEVPAAAPTAPAQPVQTQALRANERPEGIRLLVTLCLVAAAALMALGGFLVVIGTGAVADFGWLLVVLGVATLVPRYGYSNAKSWGRTAGTAIGAAYLIFGLLLVSSLGVLAIFGVASLAFGLGNIYYMRKASTKIYLKR